MTTPLGTTARFTDKQVHLFRETRGDYARTYCGLSERTDIWRDPGEDVTCGFCIRKLAERVNETVRGWTASRRASMARCTADSEGE